MMQKDESLVFQDIDPSIIKLEDNDLKLEYLVGKYLERKKEIENTLISIANNEELRRKMEQAKQDFEKATFAYMSVLRSRLDLSQEEVKNLEELRTSFMNASGEIYLKVIKNLENDLIKENREVLVKKESNRPMEHFIQVGIHEILKGKEVKANMCSICLEHEVSIALSPCGHTFCPGCKDKTLTATSNKCPSCRTHVDKTVRLYFSI